MSGIASDVRSVSEQLREQGKDQPAKLAEQAADRAERLGGYLRDNDADRILSDVEDFGRRQPWAVIAGGVAVGFLASRFLKASIDAALRPALAAALRRCRRGRPTSRRPSRPRRRGPIR